MPLQIEGRGNGIKTNVVNNAEIAKALERPADCEPLPPLLPVKSPSVLLAPLKPCVLTLSLSGFPCCRHAQVLWL